MKEKNCCKLRLKIYVGPPGIGKTTMTKKNPGRFIDPEESIDWRGLDCRYDLYPFELFRDGKRALCEHEVDWSALWTEQILPRIYLAMCLQKDIVMGLVTPLNIEAVSRFLFAFREQVGVVIPQEEKHYEWCCRDKKRLKKFESGFRGWKNTHWSRLLLRGLAEEISLKILKKLPQCKTINTKAKKSSSRMAIDQSGRVLVEGFFGSWAELDSDQNIIAMFNEVEASDKGIKLRCDGTAKVCGMKIHRCDELVVLQNDINGIPLAKWIATDKLKPTKKQKKNAVIFFAGTLGPFHIGHLDTLNKAKAFLENQGYNVIGGYASTFANRRQERFGELYGLFGSVDHRNAMLQLGTLQLDWLMADFPIEHVLRSHLLEENKHPSQLVVQRLRDYGIIDSDESVTTFWVNGSDGHLDREFFGDFATHADEDSLNPLRMLIVENRSGKNAWSKKNIAEQVPGLEKYILRSRQLMKNPTSATSIRNALLSGDRVKLRKSIGLPLVESYLLGIAHKFVL